MSDQSEKSLWICIEEEIQHLEGAGLESNSFEETVGNIASKLDESGYNVSLTGGKMLQLRRALDARIAAGYPMLPKLNEALAGLTLDDVMNTHLAALDIVSELETTWPVLKGAGYIEDIKLMAADTRLNLLVAEAKSRSKKEGIRYLRENDVSSEDIIKGLGIDQGALDEIDAELAAEQAELERVSELFNAVSDKEMDERIKHLLNNDASDSLVIQVAGVTQGEIDAVKESMKKELEEKKRLAEEEAARKAAEAAGPALEDIPSDEMLEYIESIREILEFSDVESEIRAMCEQSTIPKSLVDIAVSEPEKLDELEEQAES